MCIFFASPLEFDIQITTQEMLPSEKWILRGIHSFQSRDMLGDLEGRKLLAIAAHTVETQQKPANVPSHVSLDHL